MKKLVLVLLAVVVLSGCSLMPNKRTAAANHKNVKRLVKEADAYRASGLKPDGKALSDSNKKAWAVFTKEALGLAANMEAKGK